MNRKQPSVSENDYARRGGWSESAGAGLTPGWGTSDPLHRASRFCSQPQAPEGNGGGGCPGLAGPATQPRALLHLAWEQSSQVEPQRAHSQDRGSHPSPRPCRAKAAVSRT